MPRERKRQEVVVLIEYVVEPDAMNLSETLEQLREFGAAEVVEISVRDVVEPKSIGRSVLDEDEEL
jgi:ACT domain-containing protein